METEIFQQLKLGAGKWQIICFPYLGGYANSYLDLANALDEEFEVWSLNPPGHGLSTSETVQDIGILLDMYYKELQAIIKPHCVFLGHSMGGIIAYFLAQRLLNSGDYTVDSLRLVLSACNTPCEFKGTNYFNLSNDKLIDHLISYDGIPEELIHERSLLEYFLPVIRADFRVLETSSNLDFKPLDIPVTFFWGENDKVVPMDSVILWMKYFSNEIKVISIEGGSHMFISTKAKVVAEHLGDILLRQTV